MENRENIISFLDSLTRTHCGLTAKKYILASEKTKAIYNYMPTFPFGKKMYMIKDEKLVAIIPLAVVKARYSESFLGSHAVYNDWTNVLVCKMAGVDGLQDVNSLYYKHFFTSIENYNAWVDGDKTKEYLAKDHLYPITQNFKEDGWEIEQTEYKTWFLKGYFINSTKTDTHSTKVQINQLYLDADGLYYEVNTDGNTIYPTAEMCMQANRITNVVDFDEEVVEKVKIDISASFKVTISADGFGDAKKNIMEKLRKVGIDGNDIVMVMEINNG